MRSQAYMLILICLLSACSARRNRAPVNAPAGYRQTGEASWYGDPYHGRRAANGEIYDMEKLTAAHRTLAFDTWLRVTNLTNDKRVEVRITDRGPFVGNRIIDLSRAAARQIDMLGPGIAKVRLEVIPPPKDQPVAPARIQLQAGAFSVEANALRQADRIRELGAAGATVVYDKERSLWRVIAGRFSSLGDSAGLASTLRAEGIDTLAVDISQQE